MLIHGGYASGKTHLLGDMLRSELEHGEVRFMNIVGEDGKDSIGGMGLGERGETVENLKDFRDCLADWSQLKLQAMAVDSVKPLVRLVMFDILKEDRLPRVSGKENEWGAIHFAVEGIITRLRSIAKYVVCASPSDKSVNQLDGRTYITPDLPGRAAAGSAGWFDFVAYLRASSVGPGKVSRELIIRPNEEVITRQRLPKAIIKDITIPADGGGWKAFKTEMQRAIDESKNLRKV